MKTLRNRVAVVTGAASGIGRSLAVVLAREGCILELSDVDEPGLRETRRLVGGDPARVGVERLDVADRAAVHAHADRVAGERGAVHLVVNNAGVALEAPIASMSYADLEGLMGINFWGVVHGTKAVLPHLERAGEGHIVNVSSVFGLISVPNQSAYNAAKFAVRGFTEALREELELAGSPVSATCVHPGGIRTNIARNARVGSGAARSREKLAINFDRVARTSSEKAAETIVRGVRRNARRVLIGSDAFLVDRLQRWLPTSYQRIVVSAARRRMAVP